MRRRWRRGEGAGISFYAGEDSHPDDSRFAPADCGGIRMSLGMWMGRPIRTKRLSGGHEVPSWDDPTWVTFQGHRQQIPEFAALSRNMGIVEMMETIFDGPAIGEQGNVCRLLPPQLPQLVTPAHQDGHFIRNNPRLWTAWVALGDCPPELGGLAVLPQSHVGGLLPHSAAVAEPSASNWASAHYCAGRCVVFAFVNGSLLAAQSHGESRANLGRYAISAGMSDD